MLHLSRHNKIFSSMHQFLSNFWFCFVNYIEFVAFADFFLKQFVGYLFWPPSMVYISYSLYIVAHLTKGSYQTFITFDTTFSGLLFIIVTTLWLAVFSVYELISTISQLCNVTSFRCVCDISLGESTLMPSGNTRLLQIFSCLFMRLILYLPPLDICDVPSCFLFCRRFVCCQYCVLYVFIN